MKAKTIEVCLGVGIDQLFPEYTLVDLPVLLKEDGTDDESRSKPSPCNFDHNGECLICDAWPDACAHQRYLKGDYSVESREELDGLFKR